MKAKALKELARDPRFIPGIYNYCDRWCERCPFSNRCLNYAMELEEPNGDDPATRDLTNEKFWRKLEQTFHNTIEMIRADARERGINVDDPTLRDEVREEEREERRLAAMNRLLIRTAMAYIKATDKWFEQARPAFHAKGVELQTIARLDMGDPGSEAAALREFVEVIRWYQHFIYVKLSRAIGSRSNEQLETDEETLQIASLGNKMAVDDNRASAIEAALAEIEQRQNVRRAELELASGDLISDVFSAPPRRPASDLASMKAYLEGAPKD